MSAIETGRYTSGYELVDDSMDTPENRAACERLSHEIAVIYRSIPSPPDPEEDDPRADDYADYLATLEPEEQKKALAFRKADIAARWAQIEAIEELLEIRGACLRDPSRNTGEY